MRGPRSRSGSGVFSAECLEPRLLRSADFIPIVDVPETFAWSGHDIPELFLDGVTLLNAGTADYGNAVGGHWTLTRDTVVGNAGDVSGKISFDRALVDFPGQAFGVNDDRSSRPRATTTSPSASTPRASIATRETTSPSRRRRSSTWPMRRSTPPTFAAPTATT